MTTWRIKGCLHRSRRATRDGVNPVSERGVDHERDEFMRELEEQPSRPLTGDEKRAAALDSGSASSVYAPASARVPVEPLPGDREIVDHLDTLTWSAEQPMRKQNHCLRARANVSADRPSPGGQGVPARAAFGRDRAGGSRDRLVSTIGNEDYLCRRRLAPPADWRPSGAL